MLYNFTKNHKVYLGVKFGVCVSLFPKFQQVFFLKMVEKNLKNTVYSGNITLGF